MASILAARFETRAQADSAVDALSAAGVRATERSVFYLNPPGQHAEYPIGGDSHHDEGTKESGKTAGKGAMIGSATGLALGTATGAALGEGGFMVAAAIAGAGIGGYVGSLAGGLAGTESGDARHASVEEPVERSSGMMVAIKLGDSASEEDVLRVLRRAGAIEIERAEGEWRDGTWADFDPRRTPKLVDVAVGDGPEGPAGPRA
jgi:hypothetical protein